MTEKFDYEKLRFKAGLEIHQQLDTKKLFCNCPSVLRKDEPKFIVKRKLHAIAGESGQVDVAAKHEAEKNKSFVYEGYDTTCLVELDEMPPYPINQKALEIALHVAILLNARILPITQIMRKTVINGSNTSGFQRTTLIAHDGWLVTKTGRVGIDSICLEEDSARIIERKKDQDTYRLDRLGIPLIEIATSPDMQNPEQVKEVALKIGKILRSCKVKRGIGTIRQDLNVSINNGSRVEIKGFQNPAVMIKTVETEIKRQKEIIDRGAYVKSEVRNALPDGTTEFLRPMPGSSRMYPETDLPLLKISRDKINKAKKTLPRLREEIESELRGEGLNQDMIKLLFKLNKINDFKNMLKIIDQPQLIAKLILVYPKEIASKVGKSLEEIEEKIEDFYEDILTELKKKKIAEGDIKRILKKIVSGESFEDAIKVEKKEIAEVEEKVLKILKEKPNLSPNAYMGLVMKELRGQINGKEAMEIIQKLLK